MRLLKQLGAVALVSYAGGRAVTAVPGNAFLTLILGFLTAVLALIVYAWVVRRTERRDPVEVGRRGAGPALGRGTVIGMGMFAFVIVNIAFLGDYRITGFGSLTGATALLGFMAATAVTEELLFRGVLFRILEERAGTWWSLAVTGVVFGLIHLLNPGATPWGAVAIAVEAGGMLAAAYAATRTLWLPIGLHFGWNFAASGLFSAVVSGNGANRGLIEGTFAGPTLVTGGGVGPEASLYAVLAGVILTAVFLRLAHRRGHIVPRRVFRRRRSGPGAGTTTATLAP